MLGRGYDCDGPVKCLANISRMSLARVWRRQLYGASSVALIVPSAMLAQSAGAAADGLLPGGGGATPSPRVP